MELARAQQGGLVIIGRGLRPTVDVRQVDDEDGTGSVHYIAGSKHLSLSCLFCCAI